ncbi:MAG TPA: RHS repeat-associated core domain-containing protein [Herpetosiphonaceae bacterium]|nr:RHS repeat-associated core domain-containing protein [Herpetosiphonaceae bacterium]
MNDAGGRRVKTVDAARRVTAFAYDLQDRLVAVQASRQSGTRANALRKVLARYAYDMVGNRTDVWTNGTLVEHRDFNAADQVDGWTYDPAGNLLDDGTTFTYDALNRMLTTTNGSEQRANTYNGDGTLVAQTANSATTRFTHDLVSPLSQILQTTQGTTTKHYVYGHERLYEQAGIVKTWYSGDALGSVRQTVDEAGSPLSTLNYDPWGTPEGGATPPVFGFTGEWQDAGVGLVHLRARWYAPGQGRFTARDPFEGFETQPYSLHPYQYGYSNPVLHVDPSGHCATEVGRRTCYPRGQSFLSHVAVAITREDPPLALHRVFNHDPEVAALWVPDHPVADAELRRFILQRSPLCDAFATITFIKIEHAKWKIAHPEYADWFDAGLTLGAGLLTLGNNEPVFGPDSGSSGGAPIDNVPELTGSSGIIARPGNLGRSGNARTYTPAPKEALDTVRYAQSHNGAARQGYKGGGQFKNLDQ